MKTFICALTIVAIASIAPTVAFAADLDEGYEEGGGYEGRGDYVERPPPPPVRYAQPRYYEPDYYYYDDAPVVTYYPPPYPDYTPYYRPYHYSAGLYPYRWGPRFRGWHHAYWGPRRRW
jgi:hypothetical protein